ncbi:MAG: hypothetical protein AAF773_29455, partial [Cyanobacteria bacterium P01_D01_bin.115]
LTKAYCSCRYPRASIITHCITGMHSSKEYIAGRLFETVEELKDLLDELLNKGALEIKWSRKLKNKGNLVDAN